MIKSMTGYGRAAFVHRGRTLTVEVRAVNHRHAEFGVRLPRELAPLEARVREALQKLIPRGSVSAVVAPAGPEPSPPPVIDRERIRQYAAQLKALKRELGLKGGAGLRTLLALPDVVSPPNDGDHGDAAWEPLSRGLAAAVRGLDAMRRREGAALQRDLEGRNRRILSLIGRIAARVRRRPALLRRRLRQRITDIAGGLRLDPARLAQEAALLADRSDITEELVRLRSHCSAFAAYLRQQQPVGRRLDFLLQEMNREANTIGSKAGDSAVSQLVVELKDQIEKLREQVQNVE